MYTQFQSTQMFFAGFEDREYVLYPSQSFLSTSSAKTTSGIPATQVLSVIIIAVKFWNVI